MYSEPSHGLIDVGTSCLHLSGDKFSPTDPTKKVEELRAYHAYLDKMEDLFEQDPEQDDWKVYRVLSHKIWYTSQGKEVLLKVQWHNGEKSLLPLEAVRLHNPWVCCVYRFTNN